MDTNKIQKVFLLIFVLIFCFVGLLLGVNIPLMYLLIFAWLAWLLAGRNGQKGFPVLLFAFAFIIRLCYILVIRTPRESDFALLYEAAVGVSQGGYDFSKSLYFREWAYQTAFVLYESVLVSIFGEANAPFVLQIIQALLGSGVCVLVYLTARNFVDEKVARFSALLSTGSVFAVTYVTVLANQHMTTFFLILGLYLIIDKKNLQLKGPLRGLLAGLLMALGNIMRPEGIIPLLALAGYFLFKLISPGDEKRKNLLVSAGLLIFVYIGANALASGVIREAGINPQGLCNNNPLWKLVAGLNVKSNGTMSNEDVQLVYSSQIETREDRNQFELELIKERLNSDPRKLLSLFITKHRLLWGGDPLVWSLGHLQKGDKPVKLLGFALPVREITQLFLRLHILQMFVLVFLSICGAFFRKKASVNKELMILYYILLISFAIYTLIEIQARYIHFQQGILFITSAIGIEELYRRIRVRIKTDNLAKQ